MIRMKKRIGSCLAAAAMLFALAACSQQTAQQPAEEPSRSPAAQTPAVSPEPSQETGSPAPESSADSAAGGGTLVVYFSATGNTEAVAGYIADALGADLFAITPAEPYTDDDLNWTDESSRVNAEHNDPALQAVELTTTTVDQWESYDTVFIGYPIWWGVAAWPVSSFVAANDFTGKTVIPFCTSSSSSLGDSGTLLAEAAGTGNWLEGQRFRSSADEAEVVDWVNGLNFAAEE